ncbi:MAG: hypothetical protein JJ902_03945 [Roseibium sp.]|nr:hypothetical protein [Roseibium sp.]
MQLSDAARTMLFGLWCHAWDDGVFEWEPVELKVRVFPYNAVDIEGLLSELARLDVIKGFEVGPRKYGAVRNFRKFQRPKKPNSSGVLPPEFGTYVGLKGPSSEPPPNEPPVGGENSPQMEGRGGERRGDSPGQGEQDSGVVSFSEAQGKGRP